MMATLMPDKVCRRFIIWFLTTAGNGNLTAQMILFINLGGDMGDIAPIYNAPTWQASKRTHCSGLVRLVPDGSDIYVAQVRLARQCAPITFQPYRQHGRL